MRARVFLRQALFSMSGDAGHVPPQTAVLRGTLKERDAFGVLVAVDGYEDERGKALQGPPRTLLVPATKIDHVWIEG